MFYTLTDVHLFSCCELEIKRHCFPNVIFHRISLIIFSPCFSHRRSPACCPSPSSPWMISLTTRRSTTTSTHTSSTASTAAKTSWITSVSTARPTPASWASWAATWSPAVRAPTCTSNSPWTCSRGATWSSRAPATKWCPFRWLSSTSYSATWSSWPTLRSSAPCPSSTWHWPRYTQWRTSCCSRPSTLAPSGESCSGRTFSNAWRCSPASSSNGGTRLECSATRPSESGWCGGPKARAPTSSVTPGQTAASHAWNSTLGQYWGGGGRLWYSEGLIFITICVTIISLGMEKHMLDNPSDIHNTFDTVW